MDKNYLKLKRRIKAAIPALLLIGCLDVSAQDYPFTLPVTVTATLDVKTGNKEVFQNTLLGYNIFGFESSNEKNFIRTFDPITVRFPHGLYANWYDWRTDGTRVFGTESFDYLFQDKTMKTVEIDQLGPINTFNNANIKVGINGLTALNTEKKTANKGKGYDMLWTFNMSHDGTDFTKSPETLARYKDLKSKGFEVKAIELGNECFYPGQRSSIIPNSTEYIARAKSMYQTLKAQDPTIQISVPLLRRDSWVNPNWNQQLCVDQSYFDTITVHTYIGYNPDDPSSSDDAYGVALTARDHLQSSTNNYARKYASNKPVWLSEWGVKSGGPNAASVLGMADCYLYMSENQNIYQRANWFSVNGKLNSFLVWEDYVDNGKTKSRIKQPYVKTTYGSTYEILRSVFENCTMLESNMTTAKLDNKVNAVSGKAVTKDGKTTVFVLNMTDKPVVFTVKMDGTTYTNSYTHKTMKFDNLSQETQIPIATDPLSLVKKGTCTITLPPLSISTIELDNVVVPKSPVVSITSSVDGAKFKVGDNITLSTTATDADGTIAKVNFFVNDVFFKSDFAAPYETTYVPTTAVVYKIGVRAFDNDNNYTDAFVTINVVKKEAFGGTPIAIPGTVEAEKYDEGGQDISYKDSDPENKGGAFRMTEGVDVYTNGTGFAVGSTVGGEWLEYTVNVTEAGNYDADFILHLVEQAVGS